jgi:hypothetical protein
MVEKQLDFSPFQETWRIAFEPQNIEQRFEIAPEKRL